MTVQQTSKQAYWNEVQPTLGERHHQVLKALKTRTDFSNNELAHFLNLPINSITPRVKELREKGLVKMIGTRKCKVSGRTVIVWSVNDGNDNLKLFV